MTFLARVTKSANFITLSIAYFSSTLICRPVRTGGPAARLHMGVAAAPVCKRHESREAVEAKMYRPVRLHPQGVFEQKHQIVVTAGITGEAGNGGNLSREFRASCQELESRLKLGIDGFAEGVDLFPPIPLSSLPGAAVPPHCGHAATLRTAWQSLEQTFLIDFHSCLSERIYCIRRQFNTSPVKPVLN
jgi:hypothetical protein